jgi:hypothetical protein
MNDVFIVESEHRKRRVKAPTAVEAIKRFQRHFRFERIDRLERAFPTVREL